MKKILNNLCNNSNNYNKYRIKEKRKKLIIYKDNLLVFNHKVVLVYQIFIMNNNFKI